MQLRGSIGIGMLRHQPRSLVKKWEQPRSQHGRRFHRIYYTRGQADPFPSFLSTASKRLNFFPFPMRLMHVIRVVAREGSSRCYVRALYRTPHGDTLPGSPTWKQA